MSKISEEAKQAIQNETRKLLHEELLKEVHEHRIFLRSLSQWTISAISLVFAVVIAAFFFYLGKTVNETKEEIRSQIDTKLIDYRIVEVNQEKTDEFAKIAIANSKSKIDAELSIQLNSLIDALNDTLSILIKSEVTKNLNDKMLTVFREEIKKIDKSDLTASISKSLKTIETDLNQNEDQIAQNQKLISSFKKDRNKIIRVAAILERVNNMDNSLIEFSYSYLDNLYDWTNLFANSSGYGYGTTTNAYAAQVLVLKNKLEEDLEKLKGERENYSSLVRNILIE